MTSIAWVLVGVCVMEFAIILAAFAVIAALIGNASASREDVL